MDRIAISAALEDNARDLIERARPIGPSDRILDLGCGNGIVACILRHRLGGAAKIVGFDSNRAMIERARLLEPEMDWHHGDAMNLPFASDSFDLVVCQDLLRFVPDRVGLLCEVGRVLSRRGRLLASTWKGEAPLDAVVLRDELTQVGFFDIRIEADHLPDRIAYIAKATAPADAQEQCA